VFDAAGPSVTCSPTLTIGADKLDIPSEVVYSADTTPVLTSMSKRFGTVLGGDVIEFTGTNL
jgi:imidazole glycerol phosphate synthase subunit HisF